MFEQKPQSISLTDQILDTLFLSLENQEGFDADLIQQLRILSKKGDMSKAQQVAGVLKIIQGVQNEAY